jgi:hypothetical protein
MAQAKLNSEFIAMEAGDITVFNYDGDTYEYLSSSVEYLAVGLAFPLTHALMRRNKEFCIRRTADSSSWEYVAIQGETVYRTKTGEAVPFLHLAIIRQTPLRWYQPRRYWSGNEWVTDTGACSNVATAEQLKSELLADAQSTISLWQTELQLSIISEDDKASLARWLAYIKQLQAVDTSTAPNLTLPTPPEKS